MSRYDALVIQHLESLNDVVAKNHPHPGARGLCRIRSSTGPTMWKRRPCTEEDLIQRLKGGKGVYVPAQAERAIRNYFRHSTSPPCANSRCAAPRSGSTSRWLPICERTRSPALGPRASGCRGVNEDPELRRAGAATRGVSRTRLRAPWTAIHVEPHAHASPRRSRARPHRRMPAPSAAARRRGGDRPRHRRDASAHRLRARQQFHPSGDRQVASAALAWNCGAAPIRIG